jgi:hypothetical protein
MKIVKAGGALRMGRGNQTSFNCAEGEEGRKMRVAASWWSLFGKAGQREMVARPDQLTGAERVAKGQAGVRMAKGFKRKKGER